MEGDLCNIQEHGVIPRSAAAIFDALHQNPEFTSSSVHVSLLEIYNEELSDLLVSANNNNSNTSNSKGVVSRRRHHHHHHPKQQPNWLLWKGKMVHFVGTLPTIQKTKIQFEYTIIRYRCRSKHVAASNNLNN